MRDLRLWPGVVVVAIQWLATFVPSLVIPATPIQFFGLVGGPAFGLLGLWLWWGLHRATRGHRLFVILAPLLAFIPAFLLAHPSARMLIYLYGVPLFCLGFLLWAAWARRRLVSPGAGENPHSRDIKRWVLAAAAVVTAFAWTLVRSDGVDGDMSPQITGRWASSAEDRLLVDGASDASGTVALASSGASWPGFRGPRRDGKVSGVQVLTDWQASPPEPLWKRAVGPGWSSFALAGGLLFTQEQRGEHEVVSAYEAATGEPVWQYAEAVRFWEPLAGAGPRATPTFIDGRVYALGATGLLVALEAEDGSLIWRRDIAADTGASIPEWGFASSPLVLEGKVIVHTGGPDGRGVAAYDESSGDLRWTAPAGPQSYGSLHPETLAGQRQLLLPTGDGLNAYSLEGERLWRHEWPVPGGARVVQPAVVGDAVLIGTGFGMGVRRLDVTAGADGGFALEERWTSNRLKPYYNDFVVHEGFVYGFDGRILACLDLETGELQWKGGRYGNGQLILLEDQDLLLVLTDRGEVTLVPTTPEGFNELARVEAIKGKTWNHPILADGVLYVRNAEEMAALRLPLDPSVAPAVDQPVDPATSTEPKAESVEAGGP